MKKFLSLYKIVMEDINEFFNNKFHSYQQLITNLKNGSNNIYFKKDEHIFKLFTNSRYVYYYKNRQKIILFYFNYNAWTDKIFQSVFPIYIFFKY